MNNFNLEKILNEFLDIKNIKDYCPNGLQVQGRSDIKNIILGVTACEDLIDVAIQEKADALIVHHGYFWKNESSVITKMKYNRISKLIKNDINLFAYHLPLDISKSVGNNVEFAKSLNLIINGPLPDNNVILSACTETPENIEQFVRRLNLLLDREALLISPNNKSKQISKVAICTGGGQDLIDLAADNEFDLFISGEISERTYHIAKERNIYYCAAGHHATETFGVNSLSTWLQSNLNLNARFVDIKNPV